MSNAREKLTRIVTQKPELLKNLNISIPTLQRFVGHLIDNGVTVQKWIPVSEPPTKQGWYHVAIKDLKTGKYRVENDLYAVEIAIAHGHSVGFCKEKAWPERDKLTHWCYYPEPPKGE